jgi:hypothetical protein
MITLINFHLIIDFNYLILKQLFSELKHILNSENSDVLTDFETIL